MTHEDGHGLKKRDMDLLLSAYKWPETLEMEINLYDVVLLYGL